MKCKVTSAKSKHTCTDADYRYSERVIEQLERRDVESTELKPISLDVALLKELHVVIAKWLVQMAGFFTENPTIIVNGFIKAGITSALDEEWDEIEEEEESEQESDTEDDLMRKVKSRMMMSFEDSCPYSPFPSFLKY